MSSIKNIYKHLFKAVDVSSIALFRIAFGVIMLIEVIRYFEMDWISTYWIEPEHHFPFWPFLNLEPLSGDGMYYLFYGLGALSILIILGLFYRLSSVLFFLSFTYMFLLEQTRYLNHFYLIVLFSFVLMFIPAHRSLSLDAKLFKGVGSDYIPSWCLWLLRFMIGVPFFFGGIAKINPDWLAGQPLSIWLAHDTDFPIIGQYFTEHWMIIIMSYSGLFIDLLIVPLLLFKRTRIWAFIIGFMFHVMNSELFTIGIFPWFMIASTTLFFSSSWPRTIINSLVKRPIWPIKKQDENKINTSPKNQKLILIGLGIWAFLMIALPLRHFLIPGNVSWTEDGHKYAWHMKLRTKRASGVFNIVAKDGSIQETINVEEYLMPWQERKVIARPPMIWQMAQILKKEYASEGIDVYVYADIKATLNGRRYQQFTDPNVDLASEPFPVWKAKWILPLTTPL